MLTFPEEEATDMVLDMELAICSRAKIFHCSLTSAQFSGKPLANDWMTKCGRFSLMASRALSLPSRT